MNIGKYIKANKSMVIELDEVEYLVNDATVEAIRAENKTINLIRLFDHKILPIDFNKVKEAIMNGGIVDYLDK